jgi:hypothetical protein
MPPRPRTGRRRSREGELKGSSGLRWVGVVGVILLATALLTSCNFGGPVGSLGLGCTGRIITAEDHQMSIHYHDLEAATANAVTYARTQIDTTDVDTSSLSTHVFTADADVKDANWTTYCDKDWYNQGGTVSGMAVCNDLRGRECETSQVSIDRSFVADFALAHERKTVLHGCCTRSA